ncbi:unnamed protein product [Ilex paraguariensis]|uniref:Uncharacterized protein n=2 Tax=Ilex paraguariensis TaxID=185542 RepID=A0ABC8TPF6_9AQUA
MASFAEAFARHAERFVAEIEKVEGWRNALTEAGNLSGWDLQNVANGILKSPKQQQSFSFSEDSKWAEQSFKWAAASLLSVKTPQHQEKFHPMGSAQGS